MSGAVDEGTRAIELTAELAKLVTELVRQRTAANVIHVSGDIGLRLAEKRIATLERENRELRSQLTRVGLAPVP